MSTASELLTNYQHEISELELIPASGGVFEFEVNDQLLFSKKQLERHAEAGEIIALFESFKAR